MSGPSSAPPARGEAPALDFDDGEMGSTSVGTDLFKAQSVPAYPAIARLGRYEILGRLARGGMAEVYLARAREDDGTVTHLVVKRVLKEVEHDPAMRELFLAEGRMALRLFHPNICHVYEVGEEGGMTFMALEWVHGCALRDVIRRAAPRGLPVPVAVHVLARVAAALEYVHTARGLDGRRLRLVHQDVSPHNVMIRWTGEVKLLDFGIARKVGTGQARGAAAQGKVEYMSPEQVRGEALDGRSDVFSLGVCLYEALTSKQLYARDSGAASMMAIVNDPPPRLADARPGLSPVLDGIVAKALAKSPKDRWQSAGALQAALEGWLEANGHTVGEARVAISVTPLFAAEEKAALPPRARHMTGTLPAVSEDDATVVLGGMPELPESEAWVQTFEHRDAAPSERPEPSTGIHVDVDVELAPVATPAPRPLPRALVITLVLLVCTAVGAAATWAWVFTH